jgi:hypothetical protein
LPDGQLPALNEFIDPLQALSAFLLLAGFSSDAGMHRQRHTTR